MIRFIKLIGRRIISWVKSWLPKKKIKASKSADDEVSAITHLHRLGMSAPLVPWRDTWGTGSLADLEQMVRDTSLNYPQYSITPDGRGYLILPYGLGNIIFYQGELCFKPAVLYAAPNGVRDVLKRLYFIGDRVTTKHLKHFVGEGCREITTKRVISAISEFCLNIMALNSENAKFNPRRYIREEVKVDGIPYDRPRGYPWNDQDNIIRDSIHNSLVTTQCV